MQRFAGLARRAFATVSDAPLSKKVEMTNWEKGHYINYQKMSENLGIVRSRLNRPLTYAEKSEPSLPRAPPRQQQIANFHHQ